MKSFMLYSTKYKKTGFKSSAWEDAIFHSTFISHTQIGGRLENNLNELLKKCTVHVLHQTTVDCTDVAPLKETTTHLSVFANKDTPCGRNNEGTWERSRDVPDVVDKKETAFLFVLYKILGILLGRQILQQYQTIREIFFRYHAKLR